MKRTKTGREPTPKKTPPDQHAERPDLGVVRSIGIVHAGLGGFDPQGPSGPVERERSLRRQLAYANRRAEVAERRLARMRLLPLATQVMGSIKAAQKWLTSPQKGLGGALPVAHAQTDQGYQEVKYLLGRIEHGVY